MKLLDDLGVKRGLVATLPKPLELGQPVLSVYSGKWYPAKIQGIATGKNPYTIRFFDGDVISSIPRDKICLLPRDYGEKVPLLYRGPKETVVATLPQDSTNESKLVHIPTRELLAKVDIFQVEYQKDVEYQGDTWATMGDDIAKYILLHICNEKQITYSFGGFDYKLERTPDPRRFVQVNVKTKSRRNVRLIFTRNRCEEKKNFLGGYKRIPISSLPDKYKDCWIFVANGNHGTLCQESISGACLPSECGEADSRGLPATVKILAHGTSPEAILPIVEGGFQNTPTENGSVYGKGIYLTEKCGYALNYAPCFGPENGGGPKDIGNRYVLLCRTLIGGKMETTPETTFFKNRAIRTGGSMTGSTRHIHMKPR